MPQRHPAYSQSRGSALFVAGEVALDGSNPTSVEHGFANVIAVVIGIKGSSAPADSTGLVTYNVNGTAVDFYAWGNISGTDPTLAASTGTETISYVIFGN